MSKVKSTMSHCVADGSALELQKYPKQRVWLIRSSLKTAGSNLATSDVLCPHQSTEVRIFGFSCAAQSMNQQVKPWLCKYAFANSHGTRNSNSSVGADIGLSGSLVIKKQSFSRSKGIYIHIDVQSAGARPAEPTHTNMHSANPPRYCVNRRCKIYVTAPLSQDDAQERSRSQIQKDCGRTSGRCEGAMLKLEVKALRF